MAAGTIKGITIEIEGKTSGLVKSLGNVNKSLSETQKSLKTVNDALKMDPGNIDAIKTKQNILNQAIKETEEKLKLEKQAAADAAKALEDGTITKNQYDTLQAEVAKTTSELGKLKTESESTNNQLKQLGGSTKLASLQKSLSETAAKLSTIGSKMTSLGKQLSMKVTLPIVAAGTAAVKTAASFESEMAKVSAISGATGDDLDKLSQKAREMGSNSRYSATEIGTAMEYMAMAGWKTEQILSGLDGILNLATASGEDLGTTSDIVTDALTAFGLKAEDASHFADVLAKTSANANTNVSMMGESFKYVGPLAGSMGYSIEDVSLALGLMANAGIKSTQAGTTLRTLISNMAKPTKSMQEAMDKLGVSLDDGAGNMKTLKQVMEDLRKGFGSLKISQADLTRQVAVLDQQLEAGVITEEEYEEASNKLAEAAFGAEGAMKAEAAASLAGARGLSGLLAIVNASPEDFNALETAISNSNGAAKDMADIMGDTAEGKVAVMKNKLYELGIQIGEKLIPVLEKVVGWISDLIDWFTSLDDDTQNLIITVGLLAAALGPILTVVGSLISGVGSIIGLIGKVSGAISGAGGLSSVLSGLATGPLAAIILSITAIVMWIQNWEEISEVLEFAWEKVCESIKGLLQNLADFWGGIVDEVEKGIERLLGDVNAARDASLAASQQIADSYADKIAQNRANREKYGSAWGASKSSSGSSQANIAYEQEQRNRQYASQQQAQRTASHYTNIYMGSAKVETVVSNANGTTNARGGGR